MSNQKSFLTRFIEKRWYSHAGVLFFLLPLEWLFLGLASIRKHSQQNTAYKSKLPTVVVGNIAIGGTGKTPLLIALVKHLQRQGLKVAVISRGYGSTASTSKIPVLINSHHGYQDVGDEPLEIFQATACSVVVGADRVKCVQLVETEIDCDVILADDGLQNYRLGRHVEIVVVDGLRLWGNGHCLPVGPLRERPNRIESANYCVVTNGYLHQDFITDTPVSVATVQPSFLENVKTGLRQPIMYLNTIDSIVAIAGIGNPEKFFATLNSLGLTFSTTIFPDHHAFEEHDLNIFKNKTIVMTAKDAVKCKTFAGNNCWALHVTLAPEPTFLENLTQHLTQLRELT